MSVPDLPLSEGPHFAVFSLIVAKLKQDRDLRRVVKTWRTFEGLPTDAAEWSASALPGIRLLAGIAEKGFGDVASLESDLVIEVEIATCGTNINNQLKLYRALKRACYPANDTERYQLMESLINAGAYPALFRFGGLTYNLPELALVVGRSQILMTVRETMTIS